MNKYELTLVVNANIEEEARNATFDIVRDIITKNGGKITDPGTPEKKKLAYEIQKLTEGYYAFIKFEAEAEAPAEIENRLRITNNVLRFLIIREGE